MRHLETKERGHWELWDADQVTSSLARERTSVSGDWVGTGDWGLGGRAAWFEWRRGSIVSLLWTSLRLLDSRTKVFTAVFYQVPYPSSSHRMSFPALGMSWDYHPTPCQPPFITPSSLTFFPVPPFKSRRNPSFPEASPSFSLLLSFHDRRRWPIRLILSHPQARSPSSQGRWVLTSQPFQWAKTRGRSKNS